MPRVFVQIEPFSFHLGGLQSFLVCLERSQRGKTGQFVKLSLPG